MTEQAITRARIVELARGWIGTPYRHQAALKGAGCDCLGLIRGVYRELYGQDVDEAVPAYSAAWAEESAAETMRDAARRHLVEIDPAGAAAGDVVLFRWRHGMPAKHAAILVGDGRMVHAYEGHAVTETSVPPTRQRQLAYAFRFPGVVGV